MSAFVRIGSPLFRELGLRLGIQDFSECPECGAESVFLAARAHGNGNQIVEVGMCCAECRAEPEYPDLSDVRSWFDCWSRLVAAYDDLTGFEGVDDPSFSEVEAFSGACEVLFGVCASVELYGSESCGLQ